MAYPFEYKVRLTRMKRGMIAMPGLLFNGDMDDLIEELHSVEVDDVYLVIKGTKQKLNPNMAILDGSVSMITEPPSD